MWRINLPTLGLACEQAHLHENWGKGKKRRRGGGVGEGENEPAGMTFNLESFACRFSMLKSQRSHWSTSVKWVVNRYLCLIASRSLFVMTQRKHFQGVRSEAGTERGNRAYSLRSKHFGSLPLCFCLSVNVLYFRCLDT